MKTLSQDSRGNPPITKMRQAWPNASSPRRLLDCQDKPTFVSGICHPIRRWDGFGNERTPRLSDESMFFPRQS